MREVGNVRKLRSYDTGMEQVCGALHDLCQPLTTLQCRLELAGMAGTAEAYRDAVNLGLVECARLVEAVGSMREIVYGAPNQAQATQARIAR